VVDYRIQRALAFLSQDQSDELWQCESSFGELSGPTVGIWKGLANTKKERRLPRRSTSLLVLLGGVD
jgi:hypothetical protein